MNLKTNRKGFTLVEIIVVLVILAILAAAAIPTMLGFVDDAKGKALIAQARAAYLAAQMVGTEKAAAGTFATTDIVDASGVMTAKMEELIGADVIKKNILMEVTIDVTNKGKVDTLKYLDKEKDTQVNISAGNTAEIVKNDTDAIK